MQCMSFTAIKSNTYTQTTFVNPKAEVTMIIKYGLIKGERNMGDNTDIGLDRHMD